MQTATIPADFEVQPIDPEDPTAISPCTCGTCGLTWDDGIITSWTPAPSARCPFEYFHRAYVPNEEEKTYNLTSEQRTLLMLTAAAVSRGDLSQDDRESLDDWIMDS